jgi:hypothetical protein
MMGWLPSLILAVIFAGMILRILRLQARLRVVEGYAQAIGKRYVAELHQRRQSPAPAASEAETAAYIQGLQDASRVHREKAGNLN